MCLLFCLGLGLVPFWFWSRQYSVAIWWQGEGGVGLRTWTAPFCVVCWLFALAWASWPCVSGLAAIWWRGFAYLGGAALCRPCGRSFWFWLFVLLFGAAQVWRGHLVVGLGWHGWACLDGAVFCRRPACPLFFCCLSFCPFVCGHANIAWPAGQPGPLGGVVWPCLSAL